MRRMLLMGVILVLAACSSAPRYGIRDEPGGGGTTKSVSRSKKFSKSEVGMASYYAEDFHGKLTANGETYDMYGLTAAHNPLPLKTIIRVTNLENNKSAILRINDRGPFAKGRILDCSYGAAVKLGFVGQGTAKVRIEVIELGDDEYMKRRE
ncbi:MAG: septal ring lytic transglycosylase RlpA family protein [Fidelibacterota bacterium]